MPASTLDLASSDDGLLVKVVPPQTKDADIPAGKGAYCFVIDVSGRSVPPATTVLRHKARPERVLPSRGHPS